MSIEHKNKNVLSFGVAKARKNSKGKDSVTAEVLERNSLALGYLQQLSSKKGRVGKIPIGQRAQWAKNVQSILKRLKALGFGVQELFAASASIDSETDYEDVQAYSKNLSGMQKVNSGRQIVGYKKFLEFIQLVDVLTGEGLPQLVAELTQGINLVDGAFTIPDECFEIARRLEIIANRVGKSCGLVQKFGELARIREAHLCSGGDCVWPDDQYSFVDMRSYTPMPGLTVSEAPEIIGEAEFEVYESKYESQSIGSLCLVEDEDPRIAEGIRSLRARYIEHPAARRLAGNAYFTSPEMATNESGITGSNRSLTISVHGGAMLELPIHYAGVVMQASYIGPNEYIKGRYLIRDQAELSWTLERVFATPPLQKYEGPESDLRGGYDGFQLAVFLYPNEKCDGLIPIITRGTDEWMEFVPLNAHYISLLSDSVVLPKTLPREFPYQTESLVSYLRGVITSGELEADWKRTSNLIDTCPLWNVKI